MDPTLAAIVTALAVLAVVSVVAHTRSTLTRLHARHRQMASERGLGPGEVRQLEHLARLLPDTMLADLLISPIRYNRAAAAYMEKLRAGSVSSARFYGIVLELTRLRRKVHTPGSRLRFLHSTRELLEGTQVVAYPAPADPGLVRTGRPCTVWSVNEDHFDLWPDEEAGIVGLHAGDVLAVELFRAGQGLYTAQVAIREVEPEPRPKLRMEHSDNVEVSNRREHLRELAFGTVFVTPEGAGAPLCAALYDVSGGGLSFVVPEALEPASRVRVTLPLGDSDEHPVHTECVVLRCDESPSGHWHHFCRFGDITEDTREQVIRYVFALQRRRVRESRTAQ